MQDREDSYNRAAGATGSHGFSDRKVATSSPSSCVATSHEALDAMQQVLVVDCSVGRQGSGSGELDR